MFDGVPQKALQVSARKKDDLELRNRRQQFAIENEHGGDDLLIKPTRPSKHNLKDFKGIDTKLPPPLTGEEQYQFEQFEENTAPVIDIEKEKEDMKKL